MANKTYFGFALADSMFDVAGDCRIERRVLTVEDAKGLIEAGVLSCLNKWHTATVEAMAARYGISVEVFRKSLLLSHSITGIQSS